MRPRFASMRKSGIFVKTPTRCSCGISARKPASGGDSWWKSPRKMIFTPANECTCPSALALPLNSDAVGFTSQSLPSSCACNRALTVPISSMMIQREPCKTLRCESRCLGIVGKLPNVQSEVLVNGAPLDFSSIDRPECGDRKVNTFLVADHVCEELTHKVQDVFPACARSTLQKPSKRFLEIAQTHPQSHRPGRARWYLVDDDREELVLLDVRVACHVFAVEPINEALAGDHLDLIDPWLCRLVCRCLLCTGRGPLSSGGWAAKMTLRWFLMRVVALKSAAPQRRFLPSPSSRKRRAMEKACVVTARCGVTFWCPCSSSTCLAPRACVALLWSQILMACIQSSVFSVLTSQIKGANSMVSSFNVRIALPRDEDYLHGCWVHLPHGAFLWWASASHPTCRSPHSCPPDNWRIREGRRDQELWERESWLRF